MLEEERQDRTRDDGTPPQRVPSWSSNPCCHATTCSLFGYPGIYPCTHVLMYVVKCSLVTLAIFISIFLSFTFNIVAGYKFTHSIDRSWYRTLPGK